MDDLELTAEELDRLSDNRAAAELSFSVWTDRVCGLLLRGDWMELLGAVWTVPPARKDDAKDNDEKDALEDAFARALSRCVASKQDCLRCAQVLVKHDVGLPTLGRHACEAGKWWLVLWVHAQHQCQGRKRRRSERKSERRSAKWWTGTEWPAMRKRLITATDDQLACIAILTYIGRDVGYLLTDRRLPINKRTRAYIRHWHRYERDDLDFVCRWS